MHSTLLGGRYKIISQFGTGGFSQTFLVEDLHLPGNPRCVIKQLVPQATDANSLEMARRLFDTEAQVLYKLGGHDQIPTLLAHFEENQEFYLAQEYIEGEQLSEEFSAEGVWSEDQVIVLLKEILEVLSFVHQENVIHRDIKPSNLIRRRQDGRIVLIDFGAVKQVSNRPVEHEIEAAAGTNLTIAIGTQGYMPNEQMAGKPRFSSDVYAVGIIGVRALTGMHPKKLGEDPRTSEIDWRKHAPNVSSTLITILDRMICYDFRARYQNATEALEALQRFSTESEESDILSQLFLNAEQYIAEIKADNPELQSQSNFAQGTSFDLQGNPTAPVTDEVNTLPQVSAAAPAGFLQDPGGQPGALLPGRTPKSLWKRFLKPFPILAAVAVMGITAGLLRATFFPKQAEQVTVSSGQVDNVDNPEVSPQASAKHPIPFNSIGSFPLPLELLALPPAEERAAVQLAEANRLQAAQKYHEALAAYEHAISLHPDLAPAYLGRCNSLNALQQPDQALVACNEALALNINYPEALLGKGTALEKQGNLLEALRFYTRATRIKPNLAEAWRGQSRIFRQFGRSEEATQALNRAIALDQAPTNQQPANQQPANQHPPVDPAAANPAPANQPPVDQVPANQPPINQVPANQPPANPDGAESDVESNIE